MTFAFRLQCKLSEGNQFSFPSVVTGDWPSFATKRGHKVFVQAMDANAHVGVNRFLITSSGYHDLATAKASATEAIKRLLLGAVAATVGVHFHMGECVVSRTPEMSILFTNNGRQLIQDQGNVTFYEDDLPVDFIEAHGTCTQTRHITCLIDKIVSIPHEVSEEIVLASEIYCLTHFESSSRAKFLALITAIEVLGAPTDRSAEEIEVVKKICDFVKSSQLPDEQRNKLLSACGNLRKRSIGDSVRGIVKQHLGSEREEEFASLYQIRNKLAHRGPRLDLGREVAQLQSIVEQLLASLVLS